MHDHKSVICKNQYVDNQKCKWQATLPPTKADLQVAYTITATSQKHGSIKISDVLFGDVWVCSGQSNMVFPLPHVSPQTSIIAKKQTVNYSSIHLLGE